MHKRKLSQLLLLFIISLVPFEFLSAQKKLDHEVFLEKIRNSSDTIYSECIKEYDAFLKDFPDDIPVLIEKCKFIQLAQYDEEDEYNPHQNEFDSCSADLIKRFPDNPEVLVFQTTYLWGDELKKVFTNAEKAIAEDSLKWTHENLALLYKAESEYYYYESDYRLAFSYITRAIRHDGQYKTSVDYAQILMELDQKAAALNALTSSDDTITDPWQLSQKAELLIELKEFSGALDIFDKIREIDSAYISNTELASTFEGIGKYDLARKYLIADTVNTWNKEGALRNLLKHDLKYQDGTTCIVTYNELRDSGFSCDPLGFYRLKLFFLHPFQPWKFRDVAGIITLLLVLTILLVIPYIWILPIYFVGHHWKSILNKEPYSSPWRLRTFWLVSAGFLFASLFTAMADPEIIYTVFNSSYVETTQEQNGFEALIFIIIMSITGIAALYKVKPKILLSDTWSIGKSILAGIGFLFIFRIVTGIYVQIGTENFGISIDDIAKVKNVLMASKQEIEAVIATFGKGSALLLIGIVAPFYEEVLFRGVILDSCQRYINFNTANAFQAALFSAVHLSLFLFPVFFLFGLFAGIMRKKSGGLLPGFVFHMTNNILILIIMFAR
jgi:membrane protease YdiL (CAAX protease family)/tetratricopeptide (TPR) repeat protein